MPTSLTTDFKVYNAQFQAGMQEKLSQNATNILGGSDSAIAVVPREQLGEYEKEAFFKSIGEQLVSRQDTTSIAPANASKLTQDEKVRIKLNRKSLAESTFNAFRKIGSNPDEFSFRIGEMFAEAVTMEMINTAILAARVAVANQATNLHDITGATKKTISHSALIDTMGKMGDRYSNVAAWVIHSTTFFDLMKDLLITNPAADSLVAGVLQRVDVPALGKPLLITDSANLIVTGTPDAYFVVGLTPNGVEIIESEAPVTVFDDVTGLEQLVKRFQSEYAYTLGLKGFAWDLTNGGVNPTATALGTGTNWDKVMTSHKDLAGVVLKCHKA
jgi:hypothetical protein